MDHTTADHNPMGHHIFGGGKMHGADGSGHDEVNMPGLRGINATLEESAELAAMFRNFETITREVINLPNGIRTATRSSDEDVMHLLVSHVLGMVRRVEEGDDPQIKIQSSTLDIFFVKGKEIKTDIDVTDEGIVVTQTSDNPELVAALQKHAIEVSAMVDHGMEAVHKMMMQRGH
jgi:sRNA-binding regulator protein Hfq